MPWVRELSKLSRPRSSLSSAGITLSLSAASLSIRFLFSPVLIGMKFLTFYPAVAVVTLLCGWRYGVVALIIGTLSGWYFFMEPYNSFILKDASTVGSIIGFLLVGGFEVVLVAALRETVRRFEISKIAQEALFSDLQHRVANNLQLVISLLHHAQRNLRNPVVAAEILNDAEERIFAMSQLHRRLHDGTAFTYGLEPLLRELLATAFRDLPVTIRVSIDDVANLSMERMTAIALLVNEAAINASKHVFSKGRGTLFKVSLFREPSGSLRLEIHDDGPGAVDETSAESAHSLGMGLMNAFALQLGGALEVDNSPGMSICVRFSSGLSE